MPTGPSPAAESGSQDSTVTHLRLALPKGRQQKGVESLFAEAGVHIRTGSRSYRPSLSIEGVEAKLLKPRNVVGMLAAGARDVGFAGADWVAEEQAGLVELLDTGLDPVRLVVAGPRGLFSGDQLPTREAQERPLVIATEYVGLAEQWVAKRGLEARVLRTYGATEVFPPEDADLILDNTATGATLQASGLMILDEVMRSTTRLYAQPGAWADEGKRARIRDLVLSLRAVLEARQRVMLELNVGAAQLEEVVAALPCMRHPTVSRLHGEEGFALRAAVPRRELAALMPMLKALGATDLVVSPVGMLVP